MDNAINAFESLCPSSAFAARVSARETALGLIVKQARSADISAAAAGCGYDVVYLDLQHSCMPVDIAAQICVAAIAQGVTPWVRVGEGDAATVLRLLDAGAMGIVFPDIRTAEQASAAARLCRFPPMGHRSSAARWPQFGYRAVSAPQARAWLDKNTAVIVMVESLAGLANVKAIASVPGVSMVHVGCGDLAAEMGIVGDRDDLALFEALECIRSACSDAGCRFGVGGFSATSGAALDRVLALRPDFLTAGNEWSLMLQAMGARTQDLRLRLAGAV